MMMKEIGRQVSQMLLAVARSLPGNQRARTTRIIVQTPPSIRPRRKRRASSSSPLRTKPVAMATMPQATANSMIKRLASNFSTRMPLGICKII